MPLKTSTDKTPQPKSLEQLLSEIDSLLAMVDAEKRQGKLGLPRNHSR
ncbi:MAG: hypothetical protein OQJ97_05195 [Rhodospirillales bacterium]|nr:hypothetical protein [Rhodospirillales bacterium]